MLISVSDHDLFISESGLDDGYSDNFDLTFKRLLNDMGNGEISTIVVKDMSRLGRDHILVGYYTEYYFPDADGTFIAIYDQMNTETPPTTLSDLRIF